jgi:hypothetical protein
MIAQIRPTETVRRAFDALARRDWKALVSFVDSQALASLRQDALGMLILTTEQRLAGEKAEGGYNPQDVVIGDHLPQVGNQRIKGFRRKPTIRELASLAPADFFIEWARAAYGDGSQRDPVREVVGLYRRIIGEVMDNDESAHVVYRREHRYFDGDLKVVLLGRVMIMPLVRSGEDWRMRFNDDIGWSIDFSHVVFHERHSPIAKMSAPPRVIPAEPSPPLDERMSARPTPREVVESAFVAFETQNWAALSALVHPTVLRSFQHSQISYFAASIQSREARAQAKSEGVMAFMLSYEDSLSAEAIAQVAELEVPLSPRPRRIGELAKLSPGEFFEEWCRAAYATPSDGIGRWKRGFDRRIIGQVFEGEDLAHVLYRTPRLNAADRMPLQWSETGWRIMLNDDIGWRGDLDLERDEP